MSQPAVPDRARSFAFFVLAVVYFFFAQLVATHSADGLASGVWVPLVERAILLFLLLVGYSAMGRAFEDQRHPVRAMGLILRADWQREFGLGAALGWGMLIVCILPTVLFGGLIVSVWTSPRQWAVLLLDLLILAIASLAEEVAFRGYPFQRLVESIGPLLATLVFSALFGLAHIFNPGANAASITITIFAGWLLSAAYLRTRALWFSWGWHFAWNVSMCLLFGLPISGLTRFSPIIQSNTVGPRWMTGGDYGPEASLTAAIVILVGIVVVFRMTREYAGRYAHPDSGAVGGPNALPGAVPGTIVGAPPNAVAGAAPNGFLGLYPADREISGASAVLAEPVPPPADPAAEPPAEPDADAEASPQPDAGLPKPC